MGTGGYQSARQQERGSSKDFLIDLERRMLAIMGTSVVEGESDF